MRFATCLVMNVMKQPSLIYTIFCAPDSARAHLKRLTVLSKLKTPRVTEMVLVRSDGTLIHTETTYHSIRDNEGKFEYGLMFVTDPKELRAAGK